VALLWFRTTARRAGLSVVMTRPARPRVNSPSEL
jgi:hypothetical protein